MRSGLIVAAVGDIDEAELGRLLDRAFGSLPLGTPLALPTEWQPPTRPRTVVVERSVPQSTALMALPGIARHDPDWYTALAPHPIPAPRAQPPRLSPPHR